MRKIIITACVLTIVGFVGYTLTKNTLKETSVLAAQAFNSGREKLPLAVNSDAKSFSNNSNGNGKSGSSQGAAGGGFSGNSGSSQSGGSVSAFAPAQFINPTNTNSVNNFLYIKKSKNYTPFNFENACKDVTTLEECKGVAQSLFVNPVPTTANPNPVANNEYKIAWEEVFKAGNCALFKKNIRDLKVQIETNRYNLSQSKNPNIKQTLAKKIDSSSVVFNKNIGFLRACLIAADKKEI